MPTHLTRIATSMSWIAALPTIASCAADPDLSACGDDVGYFQGMDVHLGGAVDQQYPYDYEITADGTTFSLHQPAGGEDTAELTLDDGTQLWASVRRVDYWPELENGGNLLSIIYGRDPDSSRWGPTTATIEVTLDGESQSETFTPVYQHADPGWGAQCHGFDHAFVELGVPTTLR